MENEKLSTALAAAWETACRAGSLAADAAYGLKQTAEQTAADVRRWMQAASVEGRMNDKLMEVGELLYDTHTGHPAGSDVLEDKLREIDELKSQLDRLNRRTPPCPTCGGATRPGDRFCRTCGGPLS